jgi:hypothetical protein
MIGAGASVVPYADDNFFLRSRFLSVRCSFFGREEGWNVWSTLAGDGESLLARARRFRSQSLPNVFVRRRTDEIDLFIRIDRSAPTIRFSIIEHP